ncbi:DUF2147 domain-containing protein [Cohaesibacter haloalkalitolerans]|uniref:DUF2147 domain-containing protein n=1 Tax=Cohaesibacter haloalkalitolerans TaxID=1162980 RepID=UPI000E655E19|nr:DUF2147 domain-containing protein [Cohaesibacter haloalkalitolerans]
MKNLLFSLALIIASTATPALASDPVFGEWKTEGSNMKEYAGHYLHVRFDACGDKVCGTITRVVGINADIVGKPIIWDMQPRSNGHYNGGTIWAPDRGGTYFSKMKLTGNRLKVSGCIAGGLLCESQTWRRP